MHDYIPAGVLIITLALIVFIFGWFIKPVFDAQTANGCDNINLASVNAQEYVRWCNDHNK